MSRSDASCFVNGKVTLVIWSCQKTRKVNQGRKIWWYPREEIELSLFAMHPSAFCNGNVPEGDDDYVCHTAYMQGTNFRIISARQASRQKTSSCSAQVDTCIPKEVCISIIVR